MLHGAEVEVRLHVYRVEVGGAGDQDVEACTNHNN